MSKFRLLRHGNVTGISYHSTPALQSPKEQAYATCLGTQQTSIIQSGTSFTGWSGPGSDHKSDHWALLSGALTLRPLACNLLQD